ncbi:MAG: class A beta-lactamase [Proteobacteria bacterium]|nr:class A beta-lactamase [Pseudomonadota bacterium]
MRRGFLTRRSAVMSGFAAAACAQTDGSGREFDFRFDTIEERTGGRLGLAALNTANGAWLTHRAGERFAMCSTFKWVLASEVLAHVQAGSLALDAQVHYTAADLLEYAPVTRANVARGWMTIEELCAAAVEQSDNTAANLLLAHAGGPAGLTAFVRSQGDAVTRFDRTEPALNNVVNGDQRDTTTPEAMAKTMQRLLLTDSALTQASREKLFGWLVQSQTGAARLRAGLPAAWRVGDKTGSSGRGQANDVAIAWPPGRAPILIACFVDSQAADDTMRNAAHADVARIIAETWS